MEEYLYISHQWWQMIHLTDRILIESSSDILPIIVQLYDQLSTQVDYL